MLPVLIPFLAALAFPVATLALKRGMDLTRDPYGALFLSNAAVALVFLPMLAMGDGEPVAAQKAWQPLLAAGLFVLAQVAAYLSFAGGDLTVAVPAQGTKVLAVAALTVLLTGEKVGWTLWAAAGLTVAAIVLLQDRQSAKGGGRGRLLRTLALALVASLSFAAFDVLVQKWSPDWGGLRFGAYTFLAQGLMSLGLLALPGPRLRGHEARSWRWLLLGAFIMAFITLGLVIVIALHGKATLVNILFNTRSVTSVVVVWLAGRWFGNREAKAGRGAMLHRLLGAACMMAAVVLALLQAAGNASAAALLPPGHRDPAGYGVTGGLHRHCGGAGHRRRAPAGPRGHEAATHRCPPGGPWIAGGGHRHPGQLGSLPGPLLRAAEASGAPWGIQAAGYPAGDARSFRVMVEP